jgi:TolB protein
MKRIRRIGVCLSTVMAGVVIPIFPSTATATATATGAATATGRNGLIAFAIQDSTGIQIATVRSDGSHFQKLTSGDMISLDPTWSPDGKHLVFTHDTANGTRLFRTDAQGRNPTLLVKDAVGWRDRTASYSPDGRRIAFARCGPGDGSCGISVMNSDGSNPRVLVPADTGLEFGSFDPTFTPDGKSVVFQGARRNTQSALFQIPVAGGAERQLTPTRLEAAQSNFAPDGRTMLFSSYCCTLHAQIYAMDTGGGHLRRLTNAAFRFDDFAPAWAPDGKSVIFASTRGHQDLCCGQIYTMHPDGSGIRVLVPENAGFLFGPAWQPLPTTNGP